MAPSKKEKTERPHCHYHGTEIGPVKCSCAGSVKVFTCHNPTVPSGYCCDRMPTNAIDGPIRTGAGELTEKRYMPFAFDAEYLQQGKIPWDNWIFCCDVCPHRQDPPPVVAKLYERRKEIGSLIRRYEDAATMDARDAVVSDIGKLA